MPLVSLWGSGQSLIPQDIWQHATNTLNIFCRLKDCGLEPNIARKCAESLALWFDDCADEAARQRVNHLYDNLG